MLTVAFERGNPGRDEQGPLAHTSFWERSTPAIGFQQMKSARAQENGPRAV